MEKKGVKNKRGRKKVFKNKQEGNRVRSQRHRDNKLNYISTLENQIKELKENITNLSKELEYYKKLVKTKNIDPDKETEDFKFLKEEDYCFNELANVITNMPMLIKQVSHLQNWENSGLMTNSRIKFIK